MRNFKLSLADFANMYNTTILQKNITRRNTPGIPGGGRMPIIGGNMAGGKPGIDGIGIPGMNGGIGIDIGMD